MPSTTKQYKVPRIAIVFFGITRSLSYTIASIEKNLISPAQTLGEIKVFAHFYDQEKIDNPRSGEVGRLMRQEHNLLPIDDLVLETPNSAAIQESMDALTKQGDLWNDGFRSLRNLVHQLHSMENATARALSWCPDVIVFARPDLKYHDSLEPVIRTAIDADAPMLLLPYWQAYGGLNDRFAIIRGGDAGSAYGMRISRALEYCHESRNPLGSEELLHYVMAGWRIQTFGQRASRVRFDGTIKYERFDHPVTWKVIKLISAHLPAKSLRRIVSGVIRLGQSALIGSRYGGLE